MSIDRCTATKGNQRCVLAAHHDASMNATPHEFAPPDPHEWFKPEVDAIIDAVPQWEHVFPAIDRLILAAQARALGVFTGTPAQLAMVERLHNDLNRPTGEGPRPTDTAASELNPNHPVTQTLHDHWHKLAAILMFIGGESEVEITGDIVTRFQQDWGADVAVVADARGGQLILRLVNGAEAQRLVKEAGGLPS